MKIYSLELILENVRRLRLDILHDKNVVFMLDYQNDNFCPVYQKKKK